MGKCHQAQAICRYGAGTGVKCTVGRFDTGHFCCAVAQSQGCSVAAVDDAINCPDLRV